MFFTVELTKTPIEKVTHARSCNEEVAEPRSKSRSIQIQSPPSLRQMSNMLLIFCIFVLFEEMFSFSLEV